MHTLCIPCIKLCKLRDIALEWFRNSVFWIKRRSFISNVGILIQQLPALNQKMDFCEHIAKTKVWNSNKQPVRQVPSISWLVCTSPSFHLCMILTFFLRSGIQIFGNLIISLYLVLVCFALFPWRYLWFSTYFLLSGRIQSQNWNRSRFRCASQSFRDLIIWSYPLTWCL
jgi:hypothetical protein